jgi:hypothetical protein
MKQQSLAVAADSNFAKFHKGTRHELFLTEMDQILPWCASIAIGNAIAREMPSTRTGGLILEPTLIMSFSRLLSSCLTTAIQRRCPPREHGYKEEVFHRSRPWRL